MKVFPFFPMPVFVIRMTSCLCIMVVYSLTLFSIFPNSSQTSESQATEIGGDLLDESVQLKMIFKNSVEAPTAYPIKPNPPIGTSFDINKSATPGGEGPITAKVQKNKGCEPGDIDLKEEVVAVLKENPEIILMTLKGHEKNLLDMVERALREQAEEVTRQQQLSEFQNPYRPEFDAQRPIRGPIDAPITIVEYSDFQCPFCRQSYRTLKQVLDKYPVQIRLVYKHLLLPSHTMARLSAQLFEAIALQSHEEAWVFHDRVFEHQDRFTLEGKEFLWAMVEDLAVDQARLARDLVSPKVLAQIERDEREANNFGFTGTPTFLINGVSLRGAPPESEFVKLIEMIRAKQERASTSNFNSAEKKQISP